MTQKLKACIWGILGFGLWIIYRPAFAQASPDASRVSASEPNYSEQAPFPLVNQLSDVLPTSRAFVGLLSLVEHYGCITGNRELQFSGDRPLSRQEFAVAIEACLNHLQSTQSLIRLSSDDFAILQQLQQEFAVELATLQSQTEQIETRLSSLEEQQFSTTSRLSGQAIFAVNAGG
ncbi:MAG TPA: hypothetical protein DCP31_22735, partial [Cyanobacteria bacterium UBA8543]|nr:hypothetical protein [Cyanobacteria bacterium UBA8543]